MRAEKELFQELEIAAALFSDGDWIESKDQDTSGNVRLIQLADIGNGNFINKSNRFMNIETAKRLNCTFLNKGDILIARMPDPLGRCCIFPFDEHEKYVTVVDIAILRLKNNYDNSYIKHLINTPQIRHEISIQTTGTTRTRITRKKLEKLKIPLPALAEQQKIAAILDAADSLRQKDQQLVERYTALSQSLFLEMFGDPETNSMKLSEKLFSDVLDLITYGLTVRPEYLHEGIPLISARKIRTGKVNFEDAPKISKSDFDKLSDKAKPVMNDILFSKTGSIGHCALVNTKLDFAISQNAARLSFKDTINSVFALSYLKTPYIQQLSKSRAKGNAVKDLQLGDMKKFKFLVPSVELQNQFAERIQLIEAQKQQAQCSLEKSEALFNSLLQRAFTGELTAKMAA